MARLVCLVIAGLGSSALGLTACVGPLGDAADGPAWLEERIQAADTLEGGYPDLADIPTYTPPTTSRQAWRQGIEDMAERREALLNDPAIEDPDAEEDAAAVAQRTRAAAERDLQRQSAN